MSRSGYSEDCDDQASLNLYRGTVERAIAGKRGQKFLTELADVLDAMPEKKLISDELIAADGQCCTIGAFCKARGIEVSNIDYYAPEEVGKAVGISRSMAAEIEYENDERGQGESPEDRWIRMKNWVSSNLAKS